MPSVTEPATVPATSSAAVVAAEGAPATEGGPIKVKKGRKPSAKKAAAIEGDTAGAEPTTPKASAPRKRTPAKKKDIAPKVADNDEANGDMTTPATDNKAKSSGKKRGAAKAGSDETPTKKGKTVGSADAETPTPAKRAKSKSEKFPTQWSEFSATDKLIVNMRKAGKPWPEIETAWSGLSGKKPGTDSIRKRFAKLEAVAQEFKPADVSPLASSQLNLCTNVFNLYFFPLR